MSSIDRTKIEIKQRLQGSWGDINHLDTISIKGDTIWLDAHCPILFTLLSGEKQLHNQLRLHGILYFDVVADYKLTDTTLWIHFGPNTWNFNKIK